ncbi:putative ran-interacting Mog1 protein [Lyophyllum shimeji]|uniref:Ran-interacting Mog1 protein n=1 Tax=Lyophyllum shimeji TaxID=47721 RepID=A0A9P3UJ58_LYOSH|nr:putative ran-interacting Mog1 protein [Lyophyllum shimeji]
MATYGFCAGLNLTKTLSRMAALIKRPLFGGAITAITPSNLIDASELRQIPDNQEVLLYPDSSVSIIVEILQKVDPTDLKDAIKFHFDSLAYDNSAVSKTVNDIDIVPNERGDATPPAAVLSGVQEVPKFNRGIPDEVHVFMALYRVELKNIDLVVTFNVPTRSEDGGAVSAEGLATARVHFDTFVRSLQIVDFSLFA